MRFLVEVLFLALSIVDATNRNQIKMNVYYEPQNAQSTHFFKKQLMPLVETDLMDHIDLKLVPTGRSVCNPAHQQYECICPNGEKECNLVNLMSCILHDYRNHVNTSKLISCIQGQLDFNDAYTHCVQKLPDAKWLAKCSSDFRGSYLSWINTLRTKALGFKLPIIPAITLNNQLNLEASFGLKTQLCKMLIGKKIKSCQESIQ